MSRPKWEVLVGNDRVLDYLKTLVFRDDFDTHPLQELTEQAVHEALTEQEQELFLLRFGERLPIRTIARRLGYSSHQVIQVKLKRLEEKVRLYIERAATSSDVKSVDE